MGGRPPPPTNRGRHLRHYFLPAGMCLFVIGVNSPSKSSSEKPLRQRCLYEAPPTYSAPHPLTPQPIRTVFTNGFLPVFLDVVLSLHHQYKKQKQNRSDKNKRIHLLRVALTLLIFTDLLWFLGFCLQFEVICTFSWFRVCASFTKETAVHFIAKFLLLLVSAVEPADESPRIHLVPSQ